MRVTCSIRAVWLLLAFAALPAEGRAQPVPVEATRYGKAALRIEGRASKPEMDAAKRQAAERALAGAGVQARWIEMVDVEGSPLIRSPFLPCAEPDPDANEAALRAWVREIHANGMAAMSWYPLTFCRAAWHAHPEWRQQFIQPYPVPGEEQLYCCINTGYGDALIRYCVYAVGRLGLDGIWFDGSVWTGIWQRPFPLSCKCDACRARFRRDTGLELPAKLDWSDPVFRRWVAWRFRVFGEFVGKLARAIRAAHPQAAVVLNHYHRPGIPWRSAVPIDRYAADIITGSEATGPDGVDLTTRLCRAYGRSQAEVWRPFDMPDAPEVSAEPLLQHALGCYVAGGLPSFGGNPFDPKMAPTAARIAPLLTALRPYAGGPSLPGVGLHVSQQTETFFFARGDGPSSASEPYWNALNAWTAALGEARMPPDYVFDADVTLPNLRRYRAFLMPLSLGLTDAQARAALAYVRGGGLLLLGMGAGQLDAQGERRASNPLARALGYHVLGVPAPDGSDAVTLTLRPVGTGKPFTQHGMRAPVRLADPVWKPLARAGTGAAVSTVVAERAYGRGRVLLVDMETAKTVGSTRVEGGRTQLRVARGTAASGRYALMFVDDPAAPMSYYPDLECRLMAFGAPKYVGGEMECDLRVGAEAHVSIEMRSSTGPLEGPIVALGPGGKVLADGRPVCDLPPDAWVHLRIAFTFAREGRPASYRLTVTLPGGARHEVEVPTANPAFRAMDWLVIYGAGTRPATFYLDNLALRRIRADGRREVALSRDFEEGPEGEADTSLLQRMVALVARRAAMPVEAQAPAGVRMGVFRGPEGVVRVHLHNRNGTLADRGRKGGPPVVLRTAFPVRAARRTENGTRLAVRRRGGRHEVTVGPVGLYAVVELTPRR